MIFLSGCFCLGTSGRFFFGLFLGQEAVFLVGAEDFIFIVHILHIALVGIEIPAAHFQKAVPEVSFLKVDNPGRVKCGAPVAGFKMQVRARGTAGRAAQADDVARAYPVAGVHFPFGQMAIESFQPVGVTDHYQIAVAAHIV